MCVCVCNGCDVTRAIARELEDHNVIAECSKANNQQSQLAFIIIIINTLTLVLSVCVCVCACVCVTDVTSTNEPRLRENTREDRDVIICVHS